MEVKAGVFLGRVSALVREELWRKCCDKMGDGGFALIHPWPEAEQGFIVRTAGSLSREIVDFDGLYFVRVPHQKKKPKRVPSAESEVELEF